MSRGGRVTGAHPPSEVARGEEVVLAFESGPESN